MTPDWPGDTAPLPHAVAEDRLGVRLAGMVGAEAHDARCEREYTPSGFIFIDCLCSLRRAKADAWDEGYLRAVEPESDIRDNPWRCDGGTA